MWSVVHLPFTCDINGVVVVVGGVNPSLSHSLFLLAMRQMGRRCPYLDENHHVLQIPPAPFVKWLQKLQAVALRVHIHFEAPTISRWVLVGVLTRVKILDREFIPVGGFQFELLTIWGSKIISLWVEFQRARNCQCSHDLKEKRWKEFSIV